MIDYFITFSWIYSLNRITDTLYITVIFNVLTLLFYHAFKLKWPDLYFSVSDRAALFISVSFKRFIAFRFIPPLIFLVFILGIYIKDNSISLNIAAAMGLLSMITYSVLTEGFAIYRLLTRSDQIRIYFNFFYQLSLHIFTMLVLLILGVSAPYISILEPIKVITPSVSGLFENIWAALLTVILAEYLRTIYSEKGLDLTETFNKSLKSINPAILNKIDNLSNIYNANSVLVKAVCIVENIQRPKWLRILTELPKSFFKIEGTYGIMQIKSKPISDLESVDLAIQRFFKNTKNLNSPESLYALIDSYNSTSGYRDLVEEAMKFIDPNSISYGRG